MAKRVIIIGSGVGGLATANLLAEAGYHVTVYEKEPTAGGRAGRLRIDGFTFDTGPSWYLMPGVFEHFYDLLGESIDDWLDLRKLEPAYKVFFSHDEPVVVTGDLHRDAQTFEAIEPGAGGALRRYVTKGNDVYQLSLRHFLYSNFERISDFFHRDIIAKIGLLPRLLLQPIDHYVRAYVRDKRLQQILEYPMVFLGTSPFTAPSMYSLMSALDFQEGVFYPMGGMYTIIESLEAMATARGVQFVYSTEVEKILTHNGAATGVRLSTGEEVPAGAVISNADLHYTETRLLEAAHQSFPEAYWRKREPGPSALLLYLGIEGRIESFEHHNLLFVDAWRENFEAIYTKKVAPEQASIYISKTSHTDPSVAPEGDENIFVLVPMPAGVEMDDQMVRQLTDHYLRQIAEMTGVGLASRAKVREVFGPNDFRTKYYSWQSSMLGQSHLLRQSAFFRTPNKSRKLRHLYYVGGSTTPGIGVPMCLIGAELVYKRMIGETKGGPVQSIRKEQAS